MPDGLDFDQHFPFPEYRKYQQEILEQVVTAFDSGKKHVVISAPTGFGKSAIAVTLASYYGSAYVATTQKSLQKQYCADFDLPEFYGKSNYDCIKDFGQKCDNPTCPKPKCIGCPYQIAKGNCLGSNLSIMNYALLFSLKLYGGTTIEKRPIAIYDECHNLEDQLTNFIGISINAKTFKRHNLSLIPFPPEKSGTIDIVKWLHEKFLPHLENSLAVVESAMSGYMDNDTKIEYGKQYSFLDKFVCQINRLLQFLMDGGEICTQVNETDISLKPLLINDFAQYILSGISERTIHISATVQSKELYAKCLGIKLKDMEYIQVGSIFPEENQPIYFAPIGSMAWKNKAATLPKMVEAVDKILEKGHNGQRGIIHTSTYEIAEYIYKHSKHRRRLVYPKSHNKAKIMEGFYESTRDDLVLLSPSLMEGLDLKGDLAEFSIICKVPFASLGDEWVKAKMNLVDGWYTESTICKLVQSTGRHVRTETEVGVTYILDSTFKNLYVQNKFRFPKWWKSLLIMRG